ncbi:MAG TPA: alpha/beta fold hydrolase [Verrucomicrobiae bacterium]|nr:alpha/beta fold hydrolase [Verrucomicrobiae bacterium]
MTSINRQAICFHSLGDEIRGVLFFTPTEKPSPAVIVCHGAGEFKENYVELCEFLAARGIAALAIDMHGHGASGGNRFHIEMREWAADVRAAVDFLQTQPAIDPKKICAFGLSSGGTAILEAAVIDSRLAALVALDATVRNSLPLPLTAFLKTLVAAGHIKKSLTGREMRVPLAKLSKANLASDPEVQKKLLADTRALEAFMAFPFPAGGEAFFVDTIERVPQIVAPTLVIWGADDKLDPPETGRLLHAALTCEKDLHIVEGNGHVGHLDRHRAKVFELTANWLLKYTNGARAQLPKKFPVVIEGERAKAIGAREKWELLSPYLRQHGRQSLAYPTLQSGMEYFVDDCGYISYVTVQHPVFSPRPKKIAFSDPVCAVADFEKLLGRFLAKNPTAVFGCISEECAAVLRGMGFKINCIGPESELPIQTYNTKGNWKELDLIKRARNEAKREGIQIREEDISKVNREELLALSKKWMGSKRVNDREIWIYARRVILESEPDVRKFVAYDGDGRVAGFVFYDPMYRDGNVFGYAANIVRSDEKRFGKLVTAIHMEAMEKFRAEGKETLNLCLAPFIKLDGGKFNDDKNARAFFDLSVKYGNEIYNFTGLAFHKSKYRGSESYLYFASKSLLPTNDIYLAFKAAEITRSYFETVGQLLRGMISSRKNKKSEATSNQKPDEKTD